MKVPPFLRKPIVHLMLVAIVGLLVYSNTFSASFHFDDSYYIRGNPLITDFSYFMDSSKTDAIALVCYSNTFNPSLNLLSAI